MDFRLTDEQLEFQPYCRKFAREVIRPVAAKHDREQSVPWDVIKEARRWKLSGLDLIQDMGSDEGGLKGVIYAEELHWGCAGIALAISASGLAAAGIAASGTPEQIGRWVPECYGIGDEIKLRGRHKPEVELAMQEGIGQEVVVGVARWAQGRPAAGADEVHEQRNQSSYPRPRQRGEHRHQPGILSRGTESRLPPGYGSAPRL